MNDSDVLERAARALREAHPGTKSGSGFTRGRIMRALHERSRRRLLGWVIGGPLAALLIGGSAWAQVTGELPRLWQQAQEWLMPVQAPTGPVLAVPQPGRKGEAKSPARSESEDHSAHQEEPEVIPAEEPAEPENVTAAESVEDPPNATPRPHAVNRRAANDQAELPRSEPAPTSEERHAEEPLSPRQEPEPSNEVPKDPEVVLFRKAHELHFKQAEPRAAIAAYEQYLDGYPAGRFVPEARYNIAINLLRLGQGERAQRLLEPFAAGRYGGYRQSEAAALLQSQILRGATGGPQQ